MLFRTNNGELIEIKRYDFPTDKLYHQKIMEIKKSTKQTAFAKLEKTLDYKNSQ
jgi:flagellum-specific peptidoglycan hydrolase FlgJ